MKTIVFLAVMGCAALAFDNVQVLAPTAFREANKNGFVEVPAMFGFPRHGEELTGIVRMPSWDNHDGCGPMARFPENGETTIALIDRGNCFFVTKVRHAQNAGAEAVLMVDNNNESWMPHMGDDGTGSDISIPSVMIHQSDGQLIKNIVNGTTPQNVLLTMSWNLPNTAITQVAYRFWTDANDIGSIPFKKNFASVAKAIKDTTVFTPQYLMMDGSLYGCTDSSAPCGNLCTNNGRYCATDPEDDPNTGWDGSDVVKMNLYQICVFQKMGEASWWDYVNTFNQMCVQPQGGAQWSRTCADGAATKLGLSTSVIATCITTSENMDGTNTFLQAQLVQAATDGVHYIPSLIINDEEYDQDLNCEPPVDVTHCDVLRSICWQYSDGDEPTVCQGSPGCGLGQVRDACGVCGGNGLIDLCGVCLPPNSAAFNKSCEGCDGIPNSGKHKDACGVCGGSSSSFAQCVQNTPTASQIASVNQGLLNVNATTLAELLALRAELNAVRESINKACFVTKPSSTPSSLAYSAQAADCPVVGGGGMNHMTVAIVASVFIVGILLGVAVGVVVWRRRQASGAYHRASLAGGDEENTTAPRGSTSAVKKHKLMVDDNEESASTTAVPDNQPPAAKAKPAKSKKASQSAIKESLLSENEEL